MENVQRRLQIILAADVVGYSSLMEDDEDKTVRSLQGCRGVFDGIIENFGGRIITTAGDSVIAVFSSAFDAVDCATESQIALEKYNADNAGNSLIQFRMGINVGDLMITGSDTYGTAINIAARLESVADPCAVFISDSVYRLVCEKSDVEFLDRGDFTVKNIAEPVRAYSVKRIKDVETTGLIDKTKISVNRFDVKLAMQQGPFYLRFGDTVNVGRSRNLNSSDVVVGFRRASQLGKQTQVKISRDGIVLADLGSTNGTFVNDVPLVEGQEMNISLSEPPVRLSLGGIRTPPVKGPCRFILEPFRHGDLALKFNLAPETRRLVGEDGLDAEWPDNERDFATTWVVATGGLLIGPGGECPIHVRDLPGTRPRARLSVEYKGFSLAPMNGAELTVDGHLVRDPSSINDGAKIVLDGVEMQFSLL
jgi:class 3 adenylate cyclase